jgi:hypothetical protein
VAAHFSAVLGTLMVSYGSTFLLLAC